MYFFIRFAQNFSSDLLKTSSTSANGRRRRRQQAHRDQEGEQSQLSGAKVYWCQAFQVSKVSGAKFFWFQRYLVPKVSGVTIQMLTTTFAKEVQTLSRDTPSFLVNSLGWDAYCIQDAGILNMFEEF